MPTALRGDMLTYRTGAAGAPSAARLMGEHLLQQTLSPEMAAMAEYYEQGVRPPTPADAVASRYARLAVNGMMPDGGALDEAVKAEADRLLDVVALESGGLVLRNPAGREGFVAWGSLRDEAGDRVLLAYGDALTTNTAQGTTVTEHIHAVPAGTRLVSAFGAYTSGSRHREQSFIVTSEGAERAEIVARRPLGDQREIMRGDILNNIVRNFSKQPVKETALDMMERATDLRRGTIRTVQASLHAMEAKEEQHGERISLGRRFADSRLSRALSEQFPMVAERLRERAVALGRIVDAGTVLIENIVNSAWRRGSREQSEVEYWNAMKLASHAEERQNVKREALKKNNISR
jgi:hypothetical protein